jgi:ABC-2 type transport system ATP-binding protein
MKTNIRIENLIKIIDGNIILNNINISFETGKIYGIIGRNGSGKSVLFKSICGFLKPTSGKIFVSGDDIYEKGLFPKDLRALIEKPTFLSAVSGFENLKLLANIQKRINDSEIIKTLEDVNLKEEKEKKYGKYSLGMKQKLGIASVLMEKPNIMIFDEPFNGVDNSSCEKIKKNILKEKENKIILISSHIEQDLIDLCDEIYYMDSGEISRNIPNKETVQAINEAINTSKDKKEY